MADEDKDKLRLRIMGDLKAYAEAGGDVDALLGEARDNLSGQVERLLEGVELSEEERGFCEKYKCESAYGAICGDEVSNWNREFAAIDFVVNYASFREIFDRADEIYSVAEEIFVNYIKEAPEYLKMLMEIGVVPDQLQMIRRFKELKDVMVEYVEKFGWDGIPKEWRDELGSYDEEKEFMTRFGGNDLQAVIGFIREQDVHMGDPDFDEFLEYAEEQLLFWMVENPRDAIYFFSTVRDVVKFKDLSIWGDLLDILEDVKKMPVVTDVLEGEVKAGYYDVEVKFWDSVRGVREETMWKNDLKMLDGDDAGDLRGKVLNLVKAAGLNNNNAMSQRIDLNIYHKKDPDISFEMYCVIDGRGQVAKNIYINPEWS